MFRKSRKRNVSMYCRQETIIDKPEPVVLDCDDGGELEINLTKISEKEYLPGERLLEKLNKKKHKKKAPISDERLFESFNNIMKIF